MAHEVHLSKPWRGIAKLAHMAAMAVEEALGEIPRAEWAHLPLLLCVAEQSRPGRMDGLDEQLFAQLEAILGTRFAPESRLFTSGRVAVTSALAAARSMLDGYLAQRVLIVAADSLVNWPTLREYEGVDRLLTATNSDGFMPGEGAGALLLGMRDGPGRLRMLGMGFSSEDAFLGSGLPLRGDGLTAAVKAALEDAQFALHDVHYRVGGMSGEQYYFKEAALALNRILRQRREDFEMWHPAECIGETGAVAGIACLALADAAGASGFAPGPTALVHLSGDDGERAAIVVTTE
jgi:3-oxoacyl-[acyl-carrier-protein] synthase I